LLAAEGIGKEKTRGQREKIIPLAKTPSCSGLIATFLVV
jgi:hypothetical protein